MKKVTQKIIMNVSRTQVNQDTYQLSQTVGHFLEIAYLLSKKWCIIIMHKILSSSKTGWAWLPLMRRTALAVWRGGLRVGINVIYRAVERGLHANESQVLYLLKSNSNLTAKPGCFKHGYKLYFAKGTFKPNPWGKIWIIVYFSGIRILSHLLGQNSL